MCGKMPVDSTEMPIFSLNYIASGVFISYDSQLSLEIDQTFAVSMANSNHLTTASQRLKMLMIISTTKDRGFLNQRKCYILKLKRNKRNDINRY